MKFSAVKVLKNLFSEEKIRWDDVLNNLEAFYDNMGKNIHVFGSQMNQLQCDL